MRTYIWMSGIAALAFTAFVSCAVGRGDQPDGAQQQLAESEDPDASLCANPNGGDTVAAGPAAATAPLPAPAASTQELDEQPATDDPVASLAPQEPAEALQGCPEGMILVEGQSCPDPEQKCTDWMEDPIQFPYARCRAYEEPARCKTDHVTMRFCIDRYEAGDQNGMPVGDVSWTQAKAACEASGKRLCQEQEWVFACEGEEMAPYPYGFVRNPAVCNFDRTEDLVTNKGDLADHREPVTANPECLSPYGVQNMVGNIDEWVVLDKPHYSQKNGGRKMMSGLKGGWWGPLRNRCRPTTVDHDEVFHELQTGYRCCADAP